MTKEELIERLGVEFGKDTEITTLGDITSKIAIVSKVRIGKHRDVTDYYEVSLNNIDEYGDIFVPDDAVIPEPANKNAIRSQSLNHGDLLLNQRTQKMKVGFVNEDYKRPIKDKLPIVGNNSMIRIQFKGNDIDLSRFVQLYLQLPYVLEYLSALPSSSKSDRKIVSSAQLQELPIPKYTKNLNQMISLSEILRTKSDLLVQAQHMRDMAEGLIEKYEKQKMDSAKLNFSKYYDVFDEEKDKKEMNILKEINKLYEIF